jgi:5'-phosphate synthase pdxT subunit
MLDLIGINAIEIRKVQQLNEIDGLIIPGGESTTIVKLLHMFDFVDDLRSHVESGMALWGTCAGMIVIARKPSKPLPSSPKFHRYRSRAKLLRSSGR